MTTRARHSVATATILETKETTRTETESTAFIAKSRTILRKNAGKESKTINCAKTNKDLPTGQSVCD
jgi:hypothetical protein